MLTREKLIEFAPGAAPLADALISAAQRFELNTASRLCMFLAQCAHESRGFTALVENLNYSAEALMKTWPKRFPDLATAEAYARQPRKIAAKVYADRLGNGNEASGDGFYFRGRGVIQLTGRENYRQASMALYNDARLEMNPDAVAKTPACIDTAGWFWSRHSFNDLADADNFELLTRKINGGLHGFDDFDRSDLDTRMDWLVRARGIFAPAPATVPQTTPRRGGRFAKP